MRPAACESATATPRSRASGAATPAITLRDRDRSRVAGRLAALVSAVIVALGAAACGDDSGDQQTGSTAAAATTAATASDDRSTTGDPQGAGGDREGGGDRESGAGSRSDGPSPAPEPASSPEPDFNAELRTIVTGSLAGLAPLADPGAVYGPPATYAEMLATASGRIEETTGRLEALEPPAGAERGTEALIDAYRELGSAVDRGADAFNSGDADRINVGRVYLTKAATRFRAALVAADQSLREAGVELPGA